MIPFGALAVPEAAAFCFRHDAVEARDAAAPFLIARLQESGFAGVLSFQQESVAVDRLDGLLEMLRRHSALLTPQTWATGTCRSGEQQPGTDA